MASWGREWLPLNQALQAADQRKSLNWEFFWHYADLSLVRASVSQLSGGISNSTNIADAF